VFGEGSNLGAIGHSECVAFARISVDPKKKPGVLCIRDLRFPVATVVAMVADGMPTEKILADHPVLEADLWEGAGSFVADRSSIRELPGPP